MKEQLRTIVAKQPGWVELRYHRRLTNSFQVQKGRTDLANSEVTAGVGARVWEDGGWGFASCVELDAATIQKAIDRARANAREIAKIQERKVPALPAVTLVTGDFVMNGFEELQRKPLKEKLSSVVDLEKETAESATQIHTARCFYREVFEEKAVVTSDGAAGSYKLVRPELFLMAYASAGGDHSTGRNGIGVTGGWEELFQHERAQGIVEATARQAVELLGAPLPPGGKATCILAPSVVGLLSHEAIGHTVEADSVLAGSVATGKLGERVASELVTLCDTGGADLGQNPSGAIPFDDEGAPAQSTTLIEKGILKSYLHNRESAAHFGVAPTGNARAWLYHDEPIIRMRNTYIRPGEQSLDEIIADTPAGYLVVGVGAGQADATGEFMFGCDYAVEVKNGKLGQKYRKATISGIAFEVLKTVDALSSEFQWDLGTGHCGKMQFAKVDAGGPWLRCKLTLGGQQ